jgi:hypothetical protein
MTNQNELLITDSQYKKQECREVPISTHITFINMRNENSNKMKEKPLTLSIPNEIPSVIRVTLVASKLFTHNCNTG